MLDIADKLPAIIEQLDSSYSALAAPKGKAQPNLSSLDLTDLQILKTASSAPGVRTRQVADVVKLSMAQVRRRAAVLESKGLLTRSQVRQGRTYHYLLGPDITHEAVKAEVMHRTVFVVDPMARQCIGLIAEALNEMAKQMNSISVEMKNLLKEIPKQDVQGKPSQ